ncbi:MAG: VWA domain-containing protein [Candidatus Omnitrophota bacterium]|nr:VWA domain-containing protein [Candidatus Omnitrophota bacterium]
MTFHSPIFFLLLPLAFLAIFYAGRKDLKSGLKFSSEDLVKDLLPTFKVFLSQKIIYLRLSAAILIIIALARPQSPVADSLIETEGIDIVVALDSSTSMLAEDFKLNGKRQARVDVIKDVVGDFIKGRKNDRIAIVTFAARAYTVCPLTLDYDWLRANLERIKCGLLEDGTAIGSGVATSLNRLKTSKAQSKVIILLTDGRNNMGKISPLTAAEAAKALNIKIYTIGAGGKGPVPFPVQDFFGNKAYQEVEIDLDEEALTKIASITAGKFYRATDTESLRKIYNEIDKLEKTPVQEKGYLEYNELLPLFLVPGLLLLILEIVLTNTILRKVP